MSYVTLSKTQLEMLQIKDINSKFWDFQFPEGLDDCDGVILPLRHKTLPKTEAYFPLVDGLVDYKSISEENDVIKAVNKFMELAIQLEEKGFKIFAFDMKSLYFDPELKPYIYLYYPLYTKNDNYPLSILELPINVNSKPLTFETNNSYIIAEIFARLRYQEKFLSKPSPKDRKKYVIDSLKLENRVDLADWFKKSYENRYNMEQCKEYFEDALQRQINRNTLETNYIERKFKGFRVGYSTFEGTAKLKESDDYKKSEETNQDAYFYDQYNNRAVISVIDGVSTARVGNGNIAANIVKETLKQSWEEFKTKEFTESTVETFFRETIKTANEKIIQKAKDIANSHAPSPAEIMSSTFTTAILEGDKVYLCSVGDSPAYIVTKDQIKRLNVEHNVDYERVINEKSIQGDRESLTQYIGKAKLNDGNITPEEIFYQFLATRLLSDEILIICSDGVVDYCPGMRYEEKEENLKNMFFEYLEKSKKLKATVYKVIAKIDESDAGDNITLIALKPEFETVVTQQSNDPKSNDENYKKEDYKSYNHKNQKNGGGQK